MNSSVAKPISARIAAARPFQPAVALGLGLGDEVYASLASSLQGKRDLLVDGLREAGLEVAVPGAALGGAVPSDHLDVRARLTPGGVMAEPLRTGLPPG